MARPRVRKRHLSACDCSKLSRIPEVTIDGQALIPGRMGIQVEITAPKCPECGERMALGHITPKVGMHPELRGYKCLACSAVITRTIDLLGAPPWNGVERRKTPR